jgi:hypothetical protein
MDDMLRARPWKTPEERTAMFQKLWDDYQIGQELEKQEAVTHTRLRRDGEEENFDEMEDEDDVSFSKMTDEERRKLIEEIVKNLQNEGLDFSMRGICRFGLILFLVRFQMLGRSLLIGLLLTVGFIIFRIRLCCEIPGFFGDLFLIRVLDASSTCRPQSPRCSKK